MEIKNGSLYDTYTFTFDTEPVKITEQSRDDRLIFVIEDTDKAVLVYKDKKNVISFYDYIYSSGEWLKVTSIQSVRNGSYLVDVLTVNESKRLVFIHDGVHGLEPWIYNLEIGTIELLKDMNENSHQAILMTSCMGQMVIFTSVHLYLVVIDNCSRLIMV